MAYPAVCPHLLGPLKNSDLIHGQDTCPWHGYRFDVTSGECLTGQSCRLTRLPDVAEVDGEVIVRVA